jgi:hypothetical protein
VDEPLLIWSGAAARLTAARAAHQRLPGDAHRLKSLTVHEGGNVMRSTLVIALAGAVILMPAAAVSQGAKAKGGTESSAKEAACRAQASEARRNAGRAASSNPAAAQALRDAAYQQCMAR